MTSAALAALVLLLASGVPEAKAETHSVFERMTRAPSFAPHVLEGARPLRHAPERIVTVAPSATEILFALGEGARVVGVSRYDDFPSEVARLPRVGGFLDPSIEAVVALEPELVIGVPSAGNRAGLERLARMGIRVLVVPGSALEDVAAATRAIARELGSESERRAEALIAGLAQSLERLERPRGGARPRVAFVLGARPLVVAGPSSFIAAILDIVGAENVVMGSIAYPQISLEALVALAPDVILDASGIGADAPWKAVTAIPAVKNARVLSVPCVDILRPGPRLVEGARRVAELLQGATRSPAIR